MYRYSMYHIATYSGSSSASSSGVQTSPAGGAPGRLAQRAAGLAGRGGDAATTGAAACSYLEPSGALRSYLELSGALWGYLELAETIWSYLELSGAIWSYLEPCEPFSINKTHIHVYS